MNKFLGVGLVNLLGISVFVMLFIVVMKIFTLEHRIPGVTEVVNIV
ncbi:MAG TPA: hypothetical protein VLH15_04290 [Dehalococcoidales bacterium]|nr:hypothetical protein [Dehalococcoidales bacterium]